LELTACRPVKFFLLKIPGPSHKNQFNGSVDLLDSYRCRQVHIIKGNTMKNRLIQKISISLMLLVFSAGSMAADVVLTPFGQSPDAMMVRVVLKKLGVDGRLEKILQADGLGDESVLITVVAGSSKGLGEAGIDKDAEIARMKAVADAAKARGMKVLVMHIGGKGRRGTLTDLFIEEAVPMADKLIVVEGGDYDGLFSRLAEDAGLEILPSNSVRETSDPLKQVLTEWGIL
jgi:hypothetical protein